MTVEEKGKRQEKRPHGADHMRSSLHLSTKIGHETKKIGIKIEYLYKIQ